MNKFILYRFKINLDIILLLLFALSVFSPYIYLNSPENTVNDKNTMKDFSPSKGDNTKTIADPNTSNLTFQNTNSKVDLKNNRDNLAALKNNNVLSVDGQNAINSMGLVQSSTWNDTNVYPSTTINQQTDSVAVDSNGYLYAATTYNISATHYLSLYKSTNNGQTWTSYKYVTSSLNLNNPKVAIDLYDNSIYVVYDVEISTSISNVLVWKVDLVNVYKCVKCGDGYNFDPSIAIDYAYGSSNYIYVTFHNKTLSSYTGLELYRSTDHGLNFNEWHHLQVPNVTLYHADVAVDPNGTVYVVWAIYWTADSSY